MIIFKKKSMYNNLKVSWCKERLYMTLNKLQGYGTLELMITSPSKDSGGAKMSQHSTLRPKEWLIHLLFLCTSMILSTRETIVQWSSYKEDPMKSFEMIDLGLMHFFFGIEIIYNIDRIFIS